MRSRASNLPRPRWRCRDGSSPPCAIACDLSRRSATTARIAWSLARNASERRSIEERITGIARPHLKGYAGPGKESVSCRKRRVRVSFPQPPGLPGRHREDGLSAERVERRLAAILAADVAGYSRLMGRDEAGTLARLKALRRELIDPMVAEHKGRIVKTTGDGLLIEFPSVVEAVACAITVQSGMGSRNAATPEDRRIEFRVGINSGDIMVEDGDIHGDGVNIAARLEGVAEPGGICVSAIVHDQVRDRLDCVFEDLGEQNLKSIARPVRVYRVESGIGPRASRPLSGVDAGGTAAVVPTARPLPDKPSIAVLPFQNMSGDPEQEYFVDGMVEEIITALSRIRWLFVIARNSSFTYKGQSIDVKQVGRELGVRYVLEGSVRKSGERVRITAQLIDAETGAHLWADRFDGSLEDIFELQDKVASSVAGVSESPEADRVKGIDFARRALEVAGDDPVIVTNAALALAYFGEDIGAIMALVDRALALNPNFARGWFISGVIRKWAGQPDLAIKHSEASMRLSPRASVGTSLGLIGMGHFLAKRFEEAAPNLLVAIQA